VLEFLRRDVLPDVPDEQLDRALDAMVNSIAVTMAAKPAVFDGDALLVTSTSTPDGGVPLAEAWAPYVGGDIAEHRVECVHADLLDSEWIGEVASVVIARMNDR